MSDISIHISIYCWSTDPILELILNKLRLDMLIDIEQINTIEMVWVKNLNKIYVLTCLK